MISDSSAGTSGPLVTVSCCDRVSEGGMVVMSKGSATADSNDDNFMACAVLDRRFL